MHESAAHHIHEPSRPARVDDGEGEDGEEIMRPLRQIKEGEDEIEERHDGKRHNEAARRGEQHRKAPSEARKDREPHRSEEEVEPHGDRPPLAAEILQSEENAEDLQGERHRRGDGDKGADGVQCHRKRDMGDIAGVELFQDVFLHTDIISVRWRKDKQIHRAQILPTAQKLNAQSACKTFFAVLQ